METSPERLSLMREWKRKITPKLIAIRGVNSVGLGKLGLVVNIEREDQQIIDNIMKVMEREGEDIPFSWKVVGRIVKLSA